MTSSGPRTITGIGHVTPLGLVNRPVPPTRVVGAAVVDDLDAPTTLLAARRTEPAHLAGGWELPGGKVEADEDPITALHREIAEELGVRVRLGSEIVPPDGNVLGWYMAENLWMRVWLVQVVEGVPAPIEDHDALRFLGAGEWLDVGWLPADVPVVRLLLDRHPSARGGTSSQVP